MASLPARDPIGDHLLTPQNAALAVIDYQPSQYDGVHPIDRDLPLENIISTVRTAKAFELRLAGRDPKRLNPAMTAHRMACEAGPTSPTKVEPSCQLKPFVTLIDGRCSRWSASHS